MQTEVDSNNRKPPVPLSFKLAWAALVIIIVGVVAGAVIQQIQKKGAVPPPHVFAELPDFSHTDETSQTVTKQTFAGAPWVADFIFTTCGGQCPFMSSRMRTLQQWLDKSELNTVKLVSFSVDPERDTPEVMTEYGVRFSADPDRWKFITGDRGQIYKLIREGFKIGVEDNADHAPEEEPIIHSNKFVLIDAEGRIRGWYSADDEEAMAELRGHIKALIDEQSQGKARN